MEPMEILGLAQKNIFGDPVGAFQGAQRGALGNQQAQMQNLQMMLGMQEDARLREMAPQIADAIAQSNMPNAKVFAEVARAVPSKALGFLGQTNNASLLQFQDKMAMRQVKEQLLADSRDARDGLEKAKAIIRNKDSSPQALSLALKTYAEFAGQISDFADQARKFGFNEREFPIPQSFSDVLLDAEKQGADRKRLEMAIEENLRDDELFPYKKALMEAQTSLARAQAGEAGRRIETEVQEDMAKYTGVMDTMSGTAQQLVKLIADIKSGDAQLNKAAKAAVTKLVSRAASNEALSEADFARAAGAENWKAALDTFLKTDFAQMGDAQAIREANDLYNKAKSIYNISRQRAQSVSGGRQVVALPFPSMTDGSNPKNTQPTATKTRTGKVKM